MIGEITCAINRVKESTSLINKINYQFIKEALWRLTKFYFFILFLFLPIFHYATLQLK